MLPGGKQISGVVILGILSGCWLRNASPVLQPTPQVTVVPVWCQPRTTEGYWTEADWAAQFDYAQRVWATAGIELRQAPAVHEPGLFWDISIPRLGDLGPHTYSLSGGEKTVVVVWLVRIIQRGADVEGPLVTGVFPLDRRWGSYVVISSFASKSTLAHELGHAFGLPHAWEWGAPCWSGLCDTEECCRNVMEYCDWLAETPEEFQLTLTAEQRSLAVDFLSAP